MMWSLFIIGAVMFVTPFVDMLLSIDLTENDAERQVIEWMMKTPLHRRMMMRSLSVSGAILAAIAVCGGR